jgi:hypothetical protein
MSSEILKTTDETIIAPDNAGIEEKKTPEIVNEAAKTSALDDELTKESNVSQANQVADPEAQFLLDSEAMTTPQLSNKTQRVFDVYNSFQKDIGPFVTFDEAQSIVDSGYDNDVYLKIIKDVEARRDREKKSFADEGRDLSLQAEALSSIREKVAKGGKENIASNLNANNFKDNYSVVKEFIDEDEVFKMGGINPELPGASKDVRTILSFAKYDDNTIAQQATDALIASLDPKVQEKYNSLNYKGQRIHVQNYKFDDGKKRLIYKIPKELGGDNKYQLFNKPGLTFADFAGFTGELIPLASEITAGILSAPSGPSGVALSTAFASGFSEMLRLYIGQKLGVNQDLTTEDIIYEGLKRGAISGSITRVAFPVFSQAAKLFKNLSGTIAEKAGLGKYTTGTLSNKIIKDVLYNYKNGLNQDKNVDDIVKKVKEQLTRSQDEGGAGLDPKDVDKIINKTFGNNNPGSALASLESSVKTSPQGLGRKKAGDLVGSKAEQAAVELEKSSMDAVDQAMETILGVKFKKIPVGTTERDVFEESIGRAKIFAQNRGIRLSNISEKLNKEWNNLSNQTYNRFKNNPEELNFNKVLIKFTDDLNTQNYAIGNNIRGQINTFYKDTKLKIPKSTGKFESPAKIFDETAAALKNKMNQLKGSDNEFAKKQLAEYTDTFNTLKFLKGQFQTGKEFKYVDLVNAKSLLDDIAATNPSLQTSIRKTQATLSAVLGTAKPLPAQLAAQQTAFINGKSIMRGKVFGDIINKLGGTPRGPIAQAKQVSEDFFPILFGNKPEQKAASAYLGNFIKGNTNKLDQEIISDFKTLIYDRFIKETTGPNAIPANKFLSNYKGSLEQIFTKPELATFRNAVSVKNQIERIQANRLTLNVKAQRTMPLLKDVPVEDINPFMIADQIYRNPSLSPKSVNQFFSSITKDQQDLVRGYFMKTLFDNTKSASGILGRDTVDGGKMFQWFSDGRNQQIFENVFGQQQVKNMKVLSAALEFMQRPEKYIKPGFMNEGQADRVRQTATRMIYGPLSHENVLIKGALFFLNKLDTKLGRELFDYDFFLEKFKNSYAFKYAPQLNDEAFTKLFNKYDAGMTQRVYTGTTAAIGGSGTQQTLRGTLEEETGLPTLPVIETIGSIPYVTTVETTKAFRKTLNNIVNSINGDETTKRQVREFRKFVKEDEKEKSN